MSNIIYTNYEIVILKVRMLETLEKEYVYILDINFDSVPNEKLTIRLYC